MCGDNPLDLHYLSKEGPLHLPMQLVRIVISLLYYYYVEILGKFVHTLKFS